MAAASSFRSSSGYLEVNVDGIPATKNAPYAYGVFSAILVAIGAVLIAVGLLCLGLKKPIMEEQVEVRRLGLQELVKMFQHEAESHALIRKKVSRKNLPHNGWRCMHPHRVFIKNSQN